MSSIFLQTQEVHKTPLINDNRLTALEWLSAMAMAWAEKSSEAMESDSYTVQIYVHLNNA